MQYKQPFTMVFRPLPIILKDGEEALYFIPLNEGTDWLRYFGEGMIRPWPSVQVHFVRIQAFTSLGAVFQSKIENAYCLSSEKVTV